MISLLNFFLVFTCLPIVPESVADSTKIYINYCCPWGESLTKSRSCEKYDKKWNPIMYSSQQGKLLAPGSIPSNFEFVHRLPDCDSMTLFSESDLPVLEENGSLIVVQMIFQRESFCITPTGVLACLTQEQLNVKNKTEKKVRKCCPSGYVYSEQRTICTSNVHNKTNFLSEDTFIHSGFPRCDSHIFNIVGKLDVDYSLNVDGTLRTKNHSSVSEYCVEHLVEQLEDKASVFICGTLPENDLRFLLYPICFFFSIFFLSITLISSFMLPSSYHALHWKCQTHYVACLLIGYPMLALTQLSGDSLKNISICVPIATAMHFFFLAAFFWLNTMCFNIWWTFRDLRPTSLDKDQETYRLILYELYAWGGPLLIVTVGAVLDQLKDEHSAFLRPNFGQKSCWFDGHMTQFVYFFGPIGILLLVNLILFTATTRELTCGLWKREVVKSTTERTALSHICLKLVIVMGITWIVDVLSWIVGGPQYMWYLPDIVNALQGVFIFIVVGCQPHVWSAVKRLWCMSESPSRVTGRSYTSNATPSIINDQSTTKPVETFC